MTIEPTSGNERGRAQSLFTTGCDTAMRAEQVVRQVIEGASEGGTKEKGTEHLLTSMTSFIGGGGMKFENCPAYVREWMDREKD